MKPTLTVLAVLIAAPVLLARPYPADPATSPPRAVKPALEKGMSAEAIIAAIGRPAEVTPLPNPEVRAEKWTYRRVVAERTVQDNATTSTIPAVIGFSADGPIMGTATELGYHVKYVKTYQVTSLLMVDGRLVLAKQWREVDQSYTN